MYPVDLQACPCSGEAFTGFGCLGRAVRQETSGRGQKAGHLGLKVGAQSRSCYLLLLLIRHAHFGKRVLYQPFLSAPHHDNTTACSHSPGWGRLAS